MKRLTILILSGPIGSGKTALAEELSQDYGVEKVSTSSLMSVVAGQKLDREELQRVGLDPYFQAGQWILDAVKRVAETSPVSEIVIVDAVRTREQAAELRRVDSKLWQVLHVHLTGDDALLAYRYSVRNRTGDSNISWADAIRSPAELAVSDLGNDADCVIDTTRVTLADIAVRVRARISRTRTLLQPCVDVLVGGQWGSEGKGNIAFFLAPEYDLLVRVGASNAGHKVRCNSSAVYTHRQLPSGTRASSAQLLLGPGAVIAPDVLLREITDCGVSSERLAIDPNALIIEQDDVQDELALKQTIGSTGTGGGAAVARRIMQRGIPGAVRAARDVPELAPYIRNSTEVLEHAYMRGDSVFVEGTQGTDLSIFHGSFPHVTSRDTTTAALLSEVGIAPQRLRRVIVAFRSYPIRVGGNSGPMGREITWETVAERSGLAIDELRAAEIGSVSGNLRRVAEFSWVQLRSSVALNGATDIALTFADYIADKNRYSCRVDQLTSETVSFVEEIESVAGVPVSLISTGFGGKSLIDRRRWR